jgi:hypothetical protein
MSVFIGREWINSLTAHAELISTRPDSNADRFQSMISPSRRSQMPSDHNRDGPLSLN